MPYSFRTRILPAMALAACLIAANTNTAQAHDYRFNGDHHSYRTRQVVHVEPRIRIVERDYHHVRHVYPSHPVRVYHTVPRRYLVGAPLPMAVTYVPVPYRLQARLVPAPRGYRYVRVDDDVLLISDITRTVVDALRIADIN